MGTRRRFIGVDIGGTKTAVVLGTEDAQVLRRAAFVTDHNGGPDLVLAAICEAIDHLRADCETEAVGISCGGPLDSRAGVVLGPPNLPGWDRVPVTEVIGGHTGLPTFLENDANAGAVAEWRFGAGQGCRNLVFITAGTGLGCGLILDGRLYAGTNGMAGEAGHIRLAPDGPEGYGKHGSFEGFCSGGGMAKLAAMRIDESRLRGVQTALTQFEQPVTVRHIAQAAASGDAVAKQIIREAGERLGEGLAMLIDILNPEVIVLGSLAVRLGDAYLGPAREVIAREALSEASSVCRVVPAQLGERTGDVAALCVAMQLGRS